MSDLDIKLKEIVWSAASISAGMDDFGALDKADQEEQVDATVAQIKQIFTDEGYRPYSHYTKITNTEGETVIEAGIPIITGKEWYERFELYLDKWRTPRNRLMSKNARLAALETARRASGVETNPLAIKGTEGTNGNEAVL